jgi:hypothetical protein
MFDLPVGHWRKRGEHVTYEGVRIHAAAGATFDNGVKNGAALAGRAIAEEQPILLSNSGRPNGVFHEIVVDSDASLFKIDPKQRPVGEADKQVRLLAQQFDFLTQTRVLFGQLWFS